MKIARFIPVLLIAVLLMSGCVTIPTINPKPTPPSWQVPVQIPVYKSSASLQDQMQRFNLPLVPDDVTNIYKYQLSVDNDSLQLSIPELKLGENTLKLDAFKWSQGAIQVNSGFPDVGFDYNVSTDLVDNYVAPHTATVFYSDLGSYINSPFDKIKLSNSPNNNISITLTTEEPIDGMVVALTDKAGNPVGPGAFVEFNNIGPTGEPTMASPYTGTKTLNLGGCILPKELDFKIVYTHHSTKGTFHISSHMNSQLEIVEIQGFDPAAAGFNLPDISIPNITPLSGIKGVTEVKIKSGKIRVVQNTAGSNTDAAFPFSINVNEFSVDGQNLVKQDTDGAYIDLAGLTITPTTSISAKASVAFADPLIYDVWNDSQGVLQPYQYNLSFAMENVVAESVSGDISAIIPDFDPSTPEWDFPIKGTDSDLQEVTYPDEIKDFNIGINDIYLLLRVQNNTSFLGKFTVTLKAFQDASGTPMMDGSEPLQANFTMDIPERDTYVFDFAKTPDYAKFLKILNSRPKYISYSYSGAFGLGTDFKVTSSDFIRPSLELAIPMSFTIPQGGVIMHDAFKQTLDIGNSSRQTVDMAKEFIDEASLHITYENNSSISLGGNFHFTTPEGKTASLTAALNPDCQDEVVLTATQELMEILSNSTGFTVAVDVTLPNNTDSPHIMSLKSTDNISFAIWVSGKINAHVPGAH